MRKIYVDVIYKNFGTMGCDADIESLVIRKQVNLAVFLIDNLNVQPHETDIQMLLIQ